MALRKLSHDLKSYETNYSEVFKGAGFSLNDDAWDLYFRETRAVHEGNSKFHFEDIPKWIKPKVKEFIAEAWLKKNLSNASIYKYKAGLDLFIDFLTNETEVNNLSSLQKHIALQYEDYLKRHRDIAQSSKEKHFEVIRGFSDFLNKQYETEIGENFYFKGVLFSKTKEEQNPKKPKDVPLEICLKIMDAIKIEEKEIEDIISSGNNKNNAINNAKNRYVYCQVLKLIIASGRRASHILNLSKKCLRKAKKGEADGVWLIWNETKTNQGEQDVFIPSPLSEIVVESVNKTIAITKELCNKEDSLNDYLYLVFGHPKSGDKLIKRPEYKNLMSFINGRKDRDGFMNKYQIKDVNGDVFHLKVHGLRHTRLNEMRKQGVGLGVIQQDAKHITIDMTNVYINGDEIAQKEFSEKVSNNEMKGDIVEFIKDKTVRVDKFTSEELERYRNNGMAVQLTHYGYCHLEVEAGPCISGNPCWIGNEGCGCKYHMYDKTNLKAIEDDVSMYKAQKDIEERIQPNSPLIGHYESIIDRYEQIQKEVLNND